jgi:hypothetical protein
MPQDYIYYWKNYAQREDFGSLPQLNQNSNVMEDITTADRVWCISLNGTGRYALVACFVVSMSGENPTGSETRRKWGRWFFNSQQNRVIFFNTNFQKSVEPLVRKLGLKTNAKFLGQSFQGKNGVALIRSEHSGLLHEYARTLKIDLLLSDSTATSEWPQAFIPEESAT